MSDLFLKDLIMYNNEGVKKYAYICLLFDKKYLPGSIVLIESLKKAGSFAEFVIIVNKNTNFNDILMRFYDKIIVIDDDIFTEKKYYKFYAYKLVEYEKVIIIDSDAIIIRYPDYIFSLKTPALCLKNNKPYSGLILIKPDIVKFKNIIKELKNTDKSYKEYIENKYKNFTIIDNRFIGIDIEDKNWSKIFGLQFLNEKPFFYESKLNINERITLPNYKLWFYYYRKLINKNYDLYENNELKEVNELSNYYIENLSRQIYDINKTLNSYLYNSKKFNIFFNTKKITKNYELYHINDNIDYYYDCVNIKNKIINIKDDLDKYSIQNNNISLILLINKNNFTIDNYKKKNIIHEFKLKIDGFTLKNILFNTNNKYVYRERKLFFNKQYSNDEIINLNLIYYKTIFESGLKSDDEHIIIFSDTFVKLRLLSLLKNNNSLLLFKRKAINFLNFELNRLNNMIYQSLYKWIYNNYSLDELDNILITDVIKEKEDIKKIIIVDNNNKNNKPNLELQEKKLFFMELYFNNIEQYYEIMYNSKKYFMINGIKYSTAIYNNIFDKYSNEL
jgi:hypothetical protein